MDIHDTLTPWAWRLDPPSASSASLGPSTSASLISTDSLTSFSHFSTQISADGVFWQDFAPTGRCLSQRAKKKMRLHRFDSDEGEGEGESQAEAEGDTKEMVNEAVDQKDAGSEDKFVNTLRRISSKVSVSGQEAGKDVDERSLERVRANAEETENGMHTGKASAPPPFATSSTSARRPKQNDLNSKSAVSSTHLIAHAIHEHTLSNDSFIHSADRDALPAPLTYKETLRLTRLIAMIFRFPKASRRIFRQRSLSRRTPIQGAASTCDSASASSSKTTSSSNFRANTSSLAATTATRSSSEADSGTQIRLKSKYTTESSSRKTLRILAKVHPEDARRDSSAVLKLIALIPATLPARILCVEWIVWLAIQAKRDEKGNIFLPDQAYLTSKQSAEVKAGDTLFRADGEVDATFKIEDVDEGVGSKKVTRSKRQRLGEEVPSIPLPEFWRRPSSSSSTMTLVTLSSDDTSRILQPDEISSLDNSEAREALDRKSSMLGKRNKVVNLSKLLAERMREKRQAKALLLRTHQTLRKRKKNPDGTDAGSTVQAAASATMNGEEHEQDLTVLDAKTIANTIANSGVARA
ncbi:uncharacterized protein MEPE_00350 [Melanopsichium pennsylvanicum]|uniref:Uncharacterized protein n=2 Tax=Melanopsichium pennsylvanicum TaxID=63383 RepID=A0AAJ5C2K0_9BASI|nr:putative protein [Melanopsichium pennsylvanicum 4]SNX81645.1 uncharacterized protein MEPE_00350 [Melanopsichium pennsylvanicum]